MRMAVTSWREDASFVICELKVGGVSQSERVFVSIGSMGLEREIASALPSALKVD
jgi:hypothetical protein